MLNKRNENELTIERMYELETMAKDYNFIYSLYLDEWKYIERVKKMPYDDILNYIFWYRKHFYIIDEVKFTKELLEKYNCSEDELFQRFKDVHKIFRYKNKNNKDLLKEQKRMVKRMNNR